MASAFATGFAVSALEMQAPDLLSFFSIRIKLSNILLFVGFAMTWQLILRSHGLYRSRRVSDLVNEWWDIGKAVGLGTLVLAAVALALDISVVNRSFLATFLAVSLGGTVLLRSGLRLLLGEARRSGRNIRRAVIVGCGERGATLGRKLRGRTDLGYLLLGYIDDLPSPGSPTHPGPEKLLGPLHMAPLILSQLEVDEVLITLPLKSHYETISRIIAVSEELGLTIRMPADFFRLHIARADVDYLDRIPIVTLRTPTPTASGLLSKRALDILGSAGALALLSPLLAAIALAIRLESRGGVLFRQERVGLGRRRFRMLKFRTMVQGAERLQAQVEADNEVQGAAFKIKDDPRITRVGRFLRKFSLDELPQLWNVLLGEMSLVGPRPLPLRDLEAFEQPWHRRRFSVKPGLTCLWQALGRHEIGFDEWMELDLQYIDQWSLRLDFEILLKTVPAVLRGTGAS